MDQEAVVVTEVPEVGAEIATATELPAIKTRKAAIPTAERSKKYRDKKKAQADKAAGRIYSTEIPTKARALEILAERITNPHVRDVAYELGVEAAEKNEIDANAFYWRNGLQQVLKSEPLELDYQAIIPSEVIHNGDLYAIWDFSMSWREPDITFEKFIETRKTLKSDWIELGRFMGIPFEEKPHRSWQQFLPQWIPDLAPGYSLGEMRNWLKKQKSALQSESVRDFLLQAPRGSMKTTAGRCFLAALLLCVPSIRMLVVTETTRLAKSQVKAFRAMWEVAHERTRLQVWFPEHCIKQGEGSVQLFESPMRSIPLPQETLLIGSFEQSLTGARFDCAWVDDGVSNLNTNTEEARQKGLEVYDAILKLREPGGIGLVVTIGTPWQAPENGGVGDLYYELKRRNENDPDKSIAILTQPAWVLKSEAAHLFPDHLNQLNEDHVQELTYPTVLTFRELIKQARANVSLFRTQLLCEYVESETSKWAVTFTEDELRVRVKPFSFFGSAPTALICGAVDTAFSQAITADRSAIVIAKLLQFNGKNTAVICSVIADRWKYSDLAVRIVEEFHKWNVQRAVIERTGPWQELQAAISRAALLRGYPVPNIVWKLPSSGVSGVSAKVVRVKAAEMLLQNGQLYFLPGDWNENFFAELIKFSGQRSNSHRKDDMCDALGELCTTFVVRDVGELKPSAAQLATEQELWEQEMLRKQHDAYFNSGPQRPNPQFTPPPQSPPGDPITSALGRFGFVKK